MTVPRAPTPEIVPDWTYPGCSMQDTDRTELALEIAAVRWRLPDGDFAVLVGVTDEGEEVTVTGALADVQPGEVIDVRGAFRRPAKHGWQFAAEGVRVREPAGGGAVVRSAKTRCWHTSGRSSTSATAVPAGCWSATGRRCSR